MNNILRLLTFVFVFSALSAEAHRLKVSAIALSNNYTKEWIDSASTQDTLSGALGILLEVDNIESVFEHDFNEGEPAGSFVGCWIKLRSNINILTPKQKQRTGTVILVREGVEEILKLMREAKREQCCQQKNN